jgi:hypothetical protein
MKKSVLYIFLLTSLFALTGCNGQKSLNADNIEVNTILINSDGSVQSAIVGEFDKPYYSEEEFNNFVDEQVTSYNETYGEEAVKVKSSKVKDETAKVILEYASIKDYSLFNRIDAEYLTAKEAVDNKNIPDSLINSKDGEKVSKEEALKDEDAKVIVFNEPLDVRIDGKVKYYSNAVLLNDNAVQSVEEGTSVVIFKP